MTSTEVLNHLAFTLLGEDLPIRVIGPDGTAFGPDEATCTVRITSDEAIHHLVRAPGELGFGRAFVSGALDIEGDIFQLVALKDQIPDVRLHPATVARLIRKLGVDSLHPPPRPPEEVRNGPTWLAHSRARDALAIRHHYDVGNDFYRLVLGPSFTYSCAVFEHETQSLEEAQANKYELICRKLDLRPGMRLLDVGCGWGGMVLHAATHHGVRAVGITISEKQAELARQRVADGGLEDRVEIRLQDYRQLDGEQFDSISSIGMFEHVGAKHLREYLNILRGLLADEGRLLNHQIGRRPNAEPRPRLRHERSRVHTRGFVHRYVFPDGELHEIGDLIGEIQRSGLEVRHLDSLREHYSLTLRHWVQNLQAGWSDAVSLVGEGRARVWLLYMAASSEMFRTGEFQVHQVLATKTPAAGQSGMPLRPRWNLGLRPPMIDLRSDRHASRERQ